MGLTISRISGVRKPRTGGVFPRRGLKPYKSDPADGGGGAAGLRRRRVQAHMT
jgi:hypothetical protein